MELAFTIIFMLLAGFFAGSETAFISIDRMQLHANTDMKERRYRILHWLLDRIEDVQGMFLIGTNICIVTATILFSNYMIKILNGDPLVPLYVTLIMTPCVLLLSDVIPKIIFRHFADSITHALAPVYLFFFVVFFPIEFIFIRVIKFAMKILGLSKTKKGSLTRDDFKALLETITGKGVLQQREKGFIERIMNIKNVVAREIMIPLNRLICVEESEEIGRIGSLMASSEWTSLPVYRDRVDNVIGYIDNKDVIRAKQNEKVKKYIREALYVPEYVTIDHVLLDMQNKASQMAFAVDEYGSVAGVITSQNLIAEVVGGIMESGDSSIENKGDYYLVSGMMDVDELEDELGVTIDKTGFETVAGFVMSQLERMPAAGDRFDYDKWTFEVISVNELRIDQIAVFLKRRKKRAVQTSNDAATENSNGAS